MDALALVPKIEHSDPYWVGRLSMAVAQAIPIVEKRPKDARADLRATLEDFLRSPLPSQELKDMLRKEIR